MVKRDVVSKVAPFRLIRMLRAVRLLRTIRLFLNLQIIVETSVKFASSVFFIGVFHFGCNVILTFIGVFLLLFSYMLAIFVVASFQ